MYFRRSKLRALAEREKHNELIDHINTTASPTELNDVHEYMVTLSAPHQHAMKIPRRIQIVNLIRDTGKIT